MKEEGVSVCITAYKAKEFIKECLDSVINQSWFKTHKNWEIIVGIDGCEKTLKYIKTIMNRYKNLCVLMMDSNKGTYITSNTIMSVAKYENIFRFDSDDIMCSNLVQTVMEKKDDCCLVRYRFKDFGTGKKGKKSGCGIAHGTIYIRKSTFIKYGGFRPWPCAADTEIHLRLSKVEKTKDISDILMKRRVRYDSLTMSNDTGMKSELRKKYKNFMNEMESKNITKKDATIELVTNTYKEIVSQPSHPIIEIKKTQKQKNIEQNIETIEKEELKNPIIIEQNTEPEPETTKDNIEEIEMQNTEPEPEIVNPVEDTPIEQKKVLTVEDKYKKIMKLRTEIKKGLVIKTTDEKGNPIFLRLTKK